MCCYFSGLVAQIALAEAGDKKAPRALFMGEEPGAVVLVSAMTAALSE